MAGNFENRLNRGLRFYTMYTTTSGKECVFGENEEEIEIINKHGGNGGMLTLNKQNKEAVLGELASNGCELGSRFLPE